ncbi:MAG: membrane protein insertase YidC [Candidatus Marinimicrobia bacterium]|nr:membrane protein insertase YidC [Candidatus Neomarinimicrobiota bacterium]
MDRRSIIGFILVFIIILLIPYYYQWIGRTQKTPAKIADTTGVIPNQREEKIPQETTTKRTTPEAKKEITIIQPATTKNIKEDSLIIENDLFIAKLSNLGGGIIKSFVLKKYKSTINNDTTLVNLIPEGKGSALYISFIDINGDTLRLLEPFDLKKISKKFDEDKHIYLKDKDSIEITYELTTDYGKVIKKLTFFADNYLFRIKQNLKDIREVIGSEFYSLNWDCGLPITEKLVKDDLYYSGSYAFSGGELDKLTVKSGKEKRSSFRGYIDWAAIRSKYFSTAIIPVYPGTYGYSLYGKSYTKGRTEIWKKYQMQIMFPADKESTVNIYIGPLDYYTIRSLNVKLERIMNFGFSPIRPISKAILVLFIKLHSLIPNYGVVLILFSIFIKIIFYPLTNKWQKSMKQMQELQPKINALREKYKNDPQRLQAETMKLYKEHKINPAGGCLPILLQMPILWALFIIFRTTIELRQAPFVLWIKDLSNPDTILTLPFSIPLYGNSVNILPIIMLITTIFQQKLSTISANKQQRLQTYLFAIVFFFIFNQFPSGLNLYYTLFNIFTIIQQKLITDRPK